MEGNGALKGAQIRAGESGGETGWHEEHWAEVAPPTSTSVRRGNERSKGPSMVDEGLGGGLVGCIPQSCDLRSPLFSSTMAGVLGRERLEDHGVDHTYLGKWERKVHGIPNQRMRPGSWWTPSRRRWDRAWVGLWTTGQGGGEGQPAIEERWSMVKI